MNKDSYFKEQKRVSLNLKYVRLYPINWNLLVYVKEMSFAKWLDKVPAVIRRVSVKEICPRVRLLIWVVNEYSDYLLGKKAVNQGIN